MEAVLHVIQGWDLHPVVDHFTIGILIIAVATDLVGSLVPTRAWVRYMALTLMVLGTLAAWASFGTGMLEAKRVWPHISPGAKDVLRVHAELGKYLAITFGILTLWRILIQLLEFVARTRVVYLVVAVLSCGALFYQGSLGGELVYHYGVGTALMSTAAPSVGATPSPSATPAESTSPAPTASMPTPVASPSAEGTASAPATSVPESGSSTSPTASGEPSPSASPVPQASPGTGGRV